MPLKNLLRTYHIKSISRLYRHYIINRIFHVNCDSYLNIFTILASYIPNFMIVSIFGSPIAIFPILLFDKKKYHHNILILLKEIMGYGTKISLDKSQHNCLNTSDGIYTTSMGQNEHIPSMDMVITPYFSYPIKKKLLVFLLNNNFRFCYNSITDGWDTDNNPKKYFFLKKNYLFINHVKKIVVISDDDTIIPGGNIYTADEYITRYRNHQSSIKVHVLDINVIIE